MLSKNKEALELLKNLIRTGGYTDKVVTSMTWLLRVLQVNEV